VDESADQPGISRRNLIRKGAIAGGAAWVAPVVVGSLASPAAAASQGGSDECAASLSFTGDPATGNTDEIFVLSDPGTRRIQIQAPAAHHCDPIPPSQLFCDTTEPVWEWTIVGPNAANFEFIVDATSGPGTPGPVTTDDDAVIVVRQNVPGSNAFSIQVEVSFTCAGNTMSITSGVYNFNA
jgi:hypothetical protein